MHPRLGVNIDHVATLRQARKTTYPSVLEAAALVEAAGADQITVHLREDRRHIQDKDVYSLRKCIQTKLNLEMAATKEMLTIALDVKPNTVTLVPEKREELTTEGGLDVSSNQAFFKDYLKSLSEAGIATSLFIDTSPAQISASKEVGADAVEIHTGHYADCFEKFSECDKKTLEELEKIHSAGIYAKKLGLSPLAGHGLHYSNTQKLVGMKLFEEYNTGHSIIARALFVGLREAVREMKGVLIST